jgi:hypothetical protein
MLEQINTLTAVLITDDTQLQKFQRRYNNFLRDHLTSFKNPSIQITAVLIDRNGAYWLSTAIRPERDNAKYILAPY